MCTGRATLNLRAPPPLHSVPRSLSSDPGPHNSRWGELLEGRPWHRFFIPQDYSNLVFLKTNPTPPPMPGTWPALKPAGENSAAAQTAREDPEADSSRRPVPQAMLEGLSRERHLCAPATHREYPGESGPLHHPLHPQALTVHMLTQHLHTSRNVPVWVMPGGPGLGSVWQWQGPTAEGQPLGSGWPVSDSEVTTLSHVARLPWRPGKPPCEQLLEPGRACSHPEWIRTPQGL